MKIEGKNAVEELIKSGKAVEKVIVQNGMRDSASQNLTNFIRSKKIKIQFADKSCLDRESLEGRHQGFIAFTEDYKYSSTQEVLNSCDENSIILILDGIVDPHNLGSIIRVSECAGVKGVFIGKNRSASVNESVIRISQGSANHVKIVKVTNINNLIDELKENGFWIYALEVGGQNIYKTDLKGKIAIIVGGEDTGVNSLTKKKSDVVLEIPLQGKVNSLNASVACGVAVFEAVRQRI
ncbi:MAG TPA: 23S rRNA (guanosine(2251)-2'-O)-methyltransferase RlmB [Clostridiales bacterium]|nr:23S rRNA (guanosine(2251)-2'-O)-methyltransferase RlmB [Clostridiales bacterium]HBJ97862.1 23S rRNA (guanosine(2251)-2'-O)-methyltransferase RlmB [Clostridiales bacterium]